MKRTKLSQSTEDYLETIYLLEQEKDAVRVNDIAKELSISLPSVTGCIRRLARKGLLEYEKYGPIRLTPKGRRLGRGVYEKHKLLAEFFMLLGVDEKTAVHDACLAEHILSNKTLDKLRSFVKKKEKIRYAVPG
jgi:DtxR family Mn-dependent transcriptional regulator